MKASYKFQEQLRYIDSKLEGSVTLPELAAHIQTIWGDPAWKKDYNGIMDFTAATLDLSETEIQLLTQSMQTDPRCSFGKWAFVVSTAETFGKLRKIDHVADVRSTLRIFFDRRSAEDWLLKADAP